MKEITTNGIAILLVEVPEDAHDFSMRRNNEIIYLRKGIINPLIGSEKSEIIDIPNTKFGFTIKDYQIIGKSTELSEEQMKEICDTDGKGYMYYLEHPKNSYCKTVQESYLSLLETNGIVDRNMIDKPNESDILEDCEDWVYARAKYKSLLEQWQEAQSKVKTYLVLKRI